jgi:translation initiation factor 2 alpha subunit (eIF-2alpha)
MGTGMSQSSGVFTFPSTGFYLILWEAKFRLVDGDVAETFIEITTNNSSYSEVAIAASVNNTGSDTDGYNATAHYIVDVTDTSNVKVRFKTGSMANNSYVIGQSGYNQTSATFIRLGDT